jgi:uncharacterized protein YdiU (UPF0061 family)
MHALGIPTTRALAATVTGEKVFRERVLPGAVLLAWREVTSALALSSTLLLAEI